MSQNELAKIVLNINDRFIKSINTYLKQYFDNNTKNLIIDRFLNIVLMFNKNLSIDNIKMNIKSFYIQKFLINNFEILKNDLINFLFRNDLKYKDLFFISKLCKLFPELKEYHSPIIEQMIKILGKNDYFLFHCHIDNLPISQKTYQWRLERLKIIEAQQFIKKTLKENI